MILHYIIPKNISKKFPHEFNFNFNITEKMLQRADCSTLNWRDLMVEPPHYLEVPSHPTFVLHLSVQLRKQHRHSCQVQIVPDQMDVLLSQPENCCKRFTTQCQTPKFRMLLQISVCSRKYRKFSP